jgi:hypothetical protein
MCSELVGMAGFEPAASCSQSRRANQAAPHPVKPAEAYPVRSAQDGHRVSPAPRACGRGYCGRAETVRYGLAAKPLRGRSSMVEPQPSKLVMRVRFPSPAPTRNPSSGMVPAQDHPGPAPGDQEDRQSRSQPSMTCPSLPGACRSWRSSRSLRCLTYRASGQWMHRAHRCTSLRRWPRWWYGMCCAGPTP